jgi:hypothetical protein
MRAPFWLVLLSLVGPANLALAQGIKIPDQVDHAIRDALTEVGAPALQQALRQSRNDARSGATAPIPLKIWKAVSCLYDDRKLLESVRYKIGDDGTSNVANLSIRYGDAYAVTLIDTIVFAKRTDALENVDLWAHELWHVKQFRDWGEREFAIRFVRNHRAVEDEAYAAPAKNKAANKRCAGGLPYPPFDAGRADRP